MKIYDRVIWAIEKIGPIIMMISIVGALVMVFTGAGDRWVFLFALPLMITVVPWSANEFVKLWRIDKEDREEMYGLRKNDDRGRAHLEELD